MWVTKSYYKSFEKELDKMDVDTEFSSPKEQRQSDLIGEIPNRLMEPCLREVSDLFGGLKSLLSFITSNSDLAKSESIMSIVQRHATNSIFKHPDDHDEFLTYVKSIEESQLVKSLQVPFLINKHIAELCVGDIYPCSNSKCIEWVEQIHPRFINNNNGQIVLLAQNKHRMCSKQGNVFCDSCGSCNGQHFGCDECGMNQCILESNKCQTENCNVYGDICGCADIPTCEYCNDYVCQDHLETCGFCDKMVCGNCEIHKCDLCKRLICDEHYSFCVACRQTFCWCDYPNKDCGETIWCTTCDDDFCGKCQSENGQWIANEWICFKCQ